MILVNFDNDSPFVKGIGQATRTESPQTSALTERVDDFCYCSIECDYIEPVFYDLPDGDLDQRSFLFQKKKSTDTIVFELYKNGLKVADITNDTYGTLYDGFDNQPNYVGYLLDFQKVFDELGAGQYFFKSVMNLLGVDIEKNSNKFNLAKYSKLAANKTVKIESYQKGNIMRSEFDFTDLLPNGWYQSIRLYGIFTDKTPVLEQDNYLNSEYVIEQIQDKIITEYTLSTNYIPASIYNMLFFQDILANKILITDYNILNEDQYFRIDVVPVDVEKERVKRRSRFTVKFKERIENNIKTNF